MKPLCTFNSYICPKDQRLRVSTLKKQSLWLINLLNPDEDLVTCTICGLDPDYRMLTTTLVNGLLPSFTELRSKILNFDQQNPKHNLDFTTTKLFSWWIHHHILLHALIVVVVIWVVVVAARMVILAVEANVKIGIIITSSILGLAKRCPASISAWNGAGRVQ